MILVDSHCHLDMLEKENYNLEDVVKRASEANVKYMQTICTNIGNFPKILEIAERFDNVFASLGVHPNEVDEVISSDRLIDLSKHPKVIGLGETGLDYYRDVQNKEKQKISFLNHINASSITGLPVIVHTREAELDTIDIMVNEYKNQEYKGLIHCFTSSKNLAKKMLDIDMYISISGIVTFKNAESIREVVEFVPLNKLLIETDSPFLAPIPMRGKINEPSFVRYVAEFIAKIKNIEIEDVARETTSNFFHLFSRANQI